ncbi:MAG: sigma-70 family RNA polymerase sigma factor [Comamonadaceae bacterium]|nr:sigma-70 family RNA polymerase sigma factor [Comamonadaceae bacterium]
MLEFYYRELLNFLAHKVRDRDTAADLTQESFARAYAAEQSGTRIRDPRALLYKIARNLLTDTYRRSDARGTPDERVVEPDDEAGPATLQPDAILESRQRFEAIADIVDSLPPRCREAFILVKFDGLSHADAAARMGIAVKTLEMQVQIALKACWTRLDALDGRAGPDGLTGQPTSRARRSRSEK